MRESNRRLHSSLICAALLAVAATAAALVPATTARPQPPRGLELSPQAFELIDLGGGFLAIDQPGYRTISVRSGSIISMVVYEPGRGEADNLGHPIVLISIGRQEYRLDCPDEAAARRFVAFVIQHQGQPSK